MTEAYPHLQLYKEEAYRHLQGYRGVGRRSVPTYIFFWTKGV